VKFTFVILVLMLGSFLAFFARAHDADPRLIGTWRSNRALTAETIRPHLKGTPEKQDRFLSVFGLMRLTYTADTITAFMPALGSQPDWTHSTKYRVTASAPDSVTIQPHDWPIGDNKPMVIHFVSPDRYWTEIATPKLVTTGWREFFERVPN
jgi:hypothetical protein